MPIRVLVVDDSLVVRRSVAAVLDGEDDLEVVATAADGYAGLKRIEELAPDVVTLDVEMPGLNGLDTLREVRRRWPRLPVVMYSTLTARGAATTLEALSLGAVDYATKPENATNREEAFAQVRDGLLPVVRLWGSGPARVLPPGSTARPGTTRTLGGLADRTTRSTATPPAPTSSLPTPLRRPRVVVVGVSTGGPDALAELVPGLPGDLPVPVVVVQHMPPIFTQMLADRLDRISAIGVTEAVDGEPLLPGHVYVAPGGRHTEVHDGPDGLHVLLSDGPAEQSCRPAADVLFRTATAATEGRLLGVVLTGMGQDAREGAKIVVGAGGSVIAQDEATSVVWGMPGYVAKDGTASVVLPLPHIAPAVASHTRLVLDGAAR